MCIQWIFFGIGFPMDFHCYFVEILPGISLKVQLDFQGISIGISLEFQLDFQWISIGVSLKY